MADIWGGLVTLDEPATESKDPWAGLVTFDEPLPASGQNSPPRFPPPSGEIPANPSTREMQAGNTDSFPALSREEMIAQGRDEAARKHWESLIPQVRANREAAIKKAIDDVGVEYEKNYPGLDAPKPAGSFSEQVRQEIQTNRMSEIAGLLDELEANKTYQPTFEDLEPLGSNAERSFLTKNIVSRTGETIAKSVKSNLQKGMAVGVSEAAALAGDDETAKKYRSAAKRVTTEQQREALKQEYMDAESMLPYAGTLRSAGQAVGESVVYGSVGGLPALATVYGANAYADAIADGRSREEALRQAGIEGVMTSAFGHYVGTGTAALAKGSGGRMASRMSQNIARKRGIGRLWSGAKGAAGEIPEEVITQYSHYMTDVAYGNREYNPDELYAELMQTAAVAGVSGGVGGAIAHNVGETSKYIDDINKARQAFVNLAEKVQRGEPISRGDLEKAGISPGKSNARQRADMARQELEAVPEEVNGNNHRGNEAVPEGYGAGPPPDAEGAVRGSGSEAQVPVAVDDGTGQGVQPVVRTPDPTQEIQPQESELSNEVLPETAEANQTPEATPTRGQEGREGLLEPPKKQRPTTFDPQSIPEGIEVEMQVIRGKTGDRIPVKRDAREAMTELNEFAAISKKLLACLKR